MSTRTPNKLPRVEELIQQIEGGISKSLDLDPQATLRLLDAINTNCESPIEQMFAMGYASCVYAGLVIESKVSWNAEESYVRDFIAAPAVIEYSRFNLSVLNWIAMQVPLGIARVDFALGRWCQDRVSNPDRPPLVRTRPLVIVECDGHEFHERTAEQAERDRSRDRAFQEQGHIVFRFTGRELWRDPIACADQVSRFLDGEKA